MFHFVRVSTTQASMGPTYVWVFCLWKGGFFFGVSCIEVFRERAGFVVSGAGLGFGGSGWVCSSQQEDQNK